MTRSFACLLLAACAGTATRDAAPRPTLDVTGAATRALVDAIARKDIDVVTNALAAPLQLGGLQFADPSCARFSSAGTIPAAQLRDFAACLVEMPLRASGRGRSAERVDIAILEYEPGIEVEVELGFGANKAWVERIGYSAPHDALPTITGDALVALRDGPPAPVPDDARGKLDDALARTRLDQLFAWLEVCIDAEGRVSGVDTREVTTPELSEVFVDAARSWKLHPFTIAGRAVPVCTLARVAYPDRSSPVETIPPRLDDARAPRMSPIALEARRVAGDNRIGPDDDDKLAVQTSGVGQIAGSFEVCIEETGTVAHIATLRSTGVRGYDNKIRATIADTWRFRPLASPICAVETFTYRQRDGGYLVPTPREATDGRGRR
jgi:hypothetical protein